MSFHSIQSLVRSFNKFAPMMDSTSPLYSMLMANYIGQDYNQHVKDKNIYDNSIIPLSCDNKTHLYLNRLLPGESHYFNTLQHIKLLQGKINIINANDQYLAFKKGCLTAKKNHTIYILNSETKPVIYLSIYSKSPNWVSIPLL
jgi:hypothetical protein